MIIRVVVFFGLQHVRKLLLANALRQAGWQTLRCRINRVGHVTFSPNANGVGAGASPALIGTHAVGVGAKRGNVAFMAVRDRDGQLDNPKWPDHECPTSASEIASNRNGRRPGPSSRVGSSIPNCTRRPPTRP